jgi:hypothetical protein
MAEDGAVCADLLVESADSAALIGEESRAEQHEPDGAVLDTCAGDVPDEKRRVELRRAVRRVDARPGATRHTCLYGSRQPPPSSDTVSSHHPQPLSAATILRNHVVSELSTRHAPRATRHAPRATRHATPNRAISPPPATPPATHPPRRVCGVASRRVPQRRGRQADSREKKCASYGGSRDAVRGYGLFSSARAARAARAVRTGGTRGRRRRRRRRGCTPQRSRRGGRRGAARP